MKYWHNSSRFLTRPAASLVFLLALGAGSSLASCAGENNDGATNDGPSIESVGSVGIKLKVAPGVTLLEVSYSITGNGFSKTGSIDVGRSPKISGTIGGIPAGNGYTITLSATSVEDATTFTGSANFDVTASETTPVSIVLTGSSKDNSGSVAVNGTVAFEEADNVAPFIDEFSVTPLTVFVGGDVTLKAVAVDPDEGPQALSYSWTSSVGTLENPTAASAKLTSSTPGTATVTLTVSDGDLTSTKTTSVSFVSTDPEAPPAPTDTTPPAPTETTPPAPTETTPPAPTETTPPASTETTPPVPPPQPLTLVNTAVATNKASSTSTAIQVPEGVGPDDVAVVFLLVTGTSAQVTGSPQGFVTAALAAAQHNLSYGKVGENSTLTWTSSPSATTGATAFFFHGTSIAVDVIGTPDQPSGSTFGLAASTQAPAAAFASGYSLFAIQLPVSSTPTVTANPAGAWLAPVSDGKQLFTWGQPYVAVESGFSFPASTGGTLSASATKRQARVFVSSPQ